MARRSLRPGELVTTEDIDLSTARPVRSWALLRWVWPLTGWWSGYRWIGRRVSAALLERAGDRATVRLNAELAGQGVRRAGERVRVRVAARAQLDQRRARLVRGRERRRARQACL